MKMDQLETNDPDRKQSLLAEELLFCEIGTLDALNFLRTAHAVVEQLDTADPVRLREGMMHALDTLIGHHVGCPNCNED
jgi:hypothetical protein